MAATVALISTILGALLKLALLLLIAAAVPVAFGLRKAGQRLSDLADQVYDEIRPVLEHLSGISGNLDQVTRAIRDDVGRVSGTITAASDRMHAAILATERRLRDFNALLDVAQEEAEELFVSSAATLRAIGRGAAALAGTDGPDFAVHESEDLDPVAGAHGGDPDHGGANGDDRSGFPTTDQEQAYGSARAEQTGPRVRPRRRDRG